MKRILIVIALVVLAGIAGIITRHSSGSELRALVSRSNESEVREEIRKTYELSPGALVELAGLNGPVKIETSDSRTAEVHIERTGSSKDALDGRKVTVESDGNSLRIRTEKESGGFMSRLFGGSAGERVTLKLPRQISLQAKGVNGSFTSTEIDGPVEVAGVNGRVQIASAAGRVSFNGVNGSIVVGIKQIDAEGVKLKGINGNVELQLAENLNADFEANGMNGRVISELTEVSVDKSKRGSYWARIGTGGTGITAKGINGNIRLTRGPALAQN